MCVNLRLDPPLHGDDEKEKESKDDASTGITFMKQPTVYILTSRRNGTLYTGVTTNLIRRVWQHKENLLEGFTKKHQIHSLVYFEYHESIRTAIAREKDIKRWRRAWKLQLIEQSNPHWNDLYDTLEPVRKFVFWSKSETTKT